MSSTVHGGWRGPNIVKDGLTLYLDASSPNSYTGIGATNILRDISGRGNNAILENGPIYESTNRGSIVFDGLNDYARFTDQVPLTIPTFTICSYINPQRFNGPDDSGGVVVFTREWARLNLGIFYGGGRGAYFLIRGNNFGTTGNQLNGVVQPFNFQIGTWYYVAYVVDLPGNNYKMFVNNTLIWSSTIVLGTDFQNPGLNAGGVQPVIASRYGGGSVRSNIKMGSFLFYNRALSNQEILQNFNVTKTRFGL